MMKIAILYLCTGEYAVFFNQFYRSVMQNLFPNAEKRFFVLTDNVNAIPNLPNVETIFTEKKNRHETMLQKYQLFLSLKDKINHKFDYVFAPNANIHIKTRINENEVLPDKELGQSLTCVLHLQFSNAFTDPKTLSSLVHNTERNPESKACIKTFPYQYCWSSAFTGGVPHEYFELCETISKWRESDAEKGIVPIWHDESYFNKYRLLHADKFRVLPIDYGMPELEVAFPKAKRRILILQKEKYMRSVS